MKANVVVGRAPAQLPDDWFHPGRAGVQGKVGRDALQQVGSYHFLGVGVGNGIAVGISSHHPGVSVGWLASGVSCSGCQGAGVAVVSSRRAWWAAVKTSATISNKKIRKRKGALRFMR